MGNNRRVHEVSVTTSTGYRVTVDRTRDDRDAMGAEFVRRVCVSQGVKADRDGQHTVPARSMVLIASVEVKS